MKLDQKIMKIKMLLLDVDGVLTDGSIICGKYGEEVKIFNAQDGFGIKMAQSVGLKVGIITGRSSEIVLKRAQELNIDEIHQGDSNKLKPYNQILLKYQLKNEEIAYIGDDLFDLPVMEKVGFSVAVANARQEVKERADFTTTTTGGAGAAREVIDIIIKTQNKWADILDLISNDYE